MSKHSSPIRHFLAVAVTAGFLLTSGIAALPAAAEEGPPSGFPSWAEVEAAKGNAAATAAEVANINGLLDSLEDKAGELGASAVKAGAGLALTQRRLDAATAEVQLLNAQSRQAAGEAAEYKKDAVAVAVQSYKTGGAGLGLFAAIAALESPENLNGVDMMHQVGEQAAVKQARASEAQAASAALEKTRAKAQQAQAELTAEAKAASDAAVAAQAAVTAQLEAKKAQGATLTAQLASLNNTTVAVEAQFRQGQEALAAYNQAQEAKRKAAEEAARRAAEQQQPAPAPAPNPGIPNPGNPNPGPAPVDPNPGDGYIPVDVLLPNIPGGAVNDPAGAKAYAQGRLGAYGWAVGEFSCLNMLWERESNWRTNATNPYSGAYGIAQSLPPGKYASAGSDWLTNYRTQIEWGLGYIKYRYGSPCGAWGHSQSVGWY